MREDQVVAPPSRLDLDGSRHRFARMRINSFVTTLIDQLQVKKLCGNGLTKVANKIAVGRELQTKPLVSRTELVSGMDKMSNFGRQFVSHLAPLWITADPYNAS